MITLKNLDFSYKYAAVFKNISLEFKDGNVYGLLGENGVGKTTLLKIISGLQFPNNGTCTVDDFIPSERNPYFLQNIFYLPEEVITEDTTPEKFINKLGVFYPRYDHSYFLNLMKELEVDANNKFNAMSYGQKKKSLLACALSLRTDYLLLDEPTNGLDIPSKALFRKVILQHSTDASTDEINRVPTIIISTHQVKDVENLIDPIVILDHDEVLLNATFEEISQRLYFEYGAEISDEALYSEMMPGGYINVLPNTFNMESKVNVEALFNAVRCNKKKIREIFALGCEL
ncbi:MAG: ABC transporter ATP-binding protein [Bacteroidales bacterium]|nr:ABC transporter ATP-binding protein [Bacteroidales bacterium]